VDPSGDEREPEIASRLKPLVRGFLEAPADDAVECRRQGGVRAGQLRRLLRENGVHRFDGRWSREGPASGKRLVQDRAQCEDVGTVIGVLCAYLLRCHVADGAEHGSGCGGGPRRGDAGAGGGGRRADLRQPEVENLDATVVRDEHVFGLQIAMRDAARMRRGKARGNLRCIVDRLTCRQGARGQHLAQRVSIQQFHDGVRRAAIDAEIEDAEDVGMRQRGDGLRFCLKTAARHRVGRERLGHNLDGDLAVQPRIPGAVDPMPPAPRADTIS
jgi:hypothetical protein